MKKLLTLIALFVSLSVSAQNSITTNFAVGASSNRQPLANLDVAYQTKHGAFGVGYLVNISNRADIPAIFYGRVGKRFHTDIYDERRNVFELSVGAAYHAYSSYYSDLRGWKPMLSAVYENYVLSNGSFILGAHYTPQQFSIVMGVKCFFSNKYKNNGCYNF